MTYRNKKVERRVLGFVKKIPPNLLRFPFDIFSALSYIPNCSVHSYQIFAKRHKTSLDEVIVYCNSETGCTHNQGKNFIIMYNDADDITQERKIFTLAHELGHVLLDHFNEEYFSQIAENAVLNKTLEREANHFAACLLCPTPVVYKLKPSGVAEIQQKFGLSYEASEISWNDYINYDRSFDISWHNDMIKLFRTA